MPPPQNMTTRSRSAYIAMKETLALTSVVALVIALVVTGCGPQEATSADSPGEETKIIRDKPAPDFTLTTLNGETVRLSDLRGYVVLLDFWATWCPPCRKSLPHVNAMQQDARLRDKGLRVFAVNARETKDKVERFMRDNKYSFPVLLDSDGAVMTSYRVRVIPTSIIIGRQGIVESVFVGYGPRSEQQLDWAIQAALKGG